MGSLAVDGPRDTHRGRPGPQRAKGGVGAFMIMVGQVSESESGELGAMSPTARRPGGPPGRWGSSAKALLWIRMILVRILGCI